MPLLPRPQTRLTLVAGSERQQMQDRLYAMMDELGGMNTLMNPPRGRRQNKRHQNRGGVEAADFPDAFFVDEPLRKELRKAPKNDTKK